MAELKQIKIPGVTMVPVKDFKVDGNNPNAMDPARFNALKKGIKKFGFLVPVITNKDLLMADGEHRWKAAKHLGMKKIPAVVLDVDEVDRRLIRQVMYRVKGEHSKVMDQDEFSFLMSNADTSLVSDIMGLDYQELVNIIEWDRLPDPGKRTREIKVKHTCPECNHQWYDKKRGER